ncbi:hypothetical protein EKN06_10885 [Croceicoccus ponticola]|uniref:Uncharacterized protein n=1 Tax=Croceicoccus ponticola TaxID=2217664 RepID=A0A437GWL9_9SPHN|nr:hypothetical protein [Croceicoccus ponticola]RVQ66512.1 hypothetical protein EKN06_10885 [Croceicoccus ponticola]
MSDVALSLLVLGVFAMIVGAWLAWKRGDRKRMALMAILAAVMAMNIAIWTIPGPAETSLAKSSPAESTLDDQSLADEARGAD